MKTNDFSPKQRQLLLKLAEGLSQREAAHAAGWHPVTVCRFLQRPEARAELERLRSEAEQRLIERLPSLVDKAIAVVEQALNSKLAPDRQLRAARIVLELAERLSRKPVPNSASASVTYDITPVEPADRSTTLIS